MLDGEPVAREATHEQLARVHEPEYLELLRAVDRPTQLDADTVCSQSSWQAATSPPESRSRQSTGTASRSCARPGITPSRPGRWASAS